MATDALHVMTADLHIHTCLSPCATLDMTPMKIVKEAREKNLAIVAITDHNSAENTAAVVESAQNTELCVIPGIEMMTFEEVHIVGLFEEVEGAISMQELAYATLQPGENDEKVFGLQVVANEFDEVEAINNRLLIGATTLRLHEVVAAIHERHGLAVAAHIDRMSFSILGQLGFIPEDLKLDALEISPHVAMAEAGERFREYKNFPFISASDAHSLEEIGRCPLRLEIARADVAELRLALAGREGRRVCGAEPS